MAGWRQALLLTFVVGGSAAAENGARPKPEAVRAEPGFPTVLSLSKEAPQANPHCHIAATEHRTGRALLALPVTPGQPPQLQLHFTHSVLGTPVQDHYSWKNGGWHLTEEQFEGEGYGLPHAAAEGEALQRHGTGWRLLLNRSVHPLVVRPLPALQMRLLLPSGQQWLLAGLSTQAIELAAPNC